MTNKSYETGYSWGWDAGYSWGWDAGYAHGYEAAQLKYDNDLNTMPIKKLLELCFVDDNPGLRGEAARVYKKRTGSKP